MATVEASLTFVNLTDTDDGIEGITFPPGAPFAVRGGLRVFF